MGYIITAILLLVGLWLLVAGLRRMWRRKPLSGSMQGLSGLLLIALGLLAAAIAMNLYTYQRLTYEAPVAELRFEAMAPQHYRVYVIPQDGDAQVYELRGDQWQIDARIIKWRGAATLLGFDTAYRLERLSGRYRDVAQARRRPHTVHALEHDRGLDIWSLARQHSGWLPWVDAVYGSANYMPMSDAARFEVTMSQSGLVTRPANEMAEQAVQQWQ
jgi:hypothetical protein